MTNNPEIAKKVDKNIFPGIQGGPLEHVIAAKAVAFYEDLQDSYKDYIHQVILNAQAMAKFFMDKGYSILTGGTDNHLFMIDIKKSRNMTGLECQKLLESCNITVNKNSIPFDDEKPFYASGIRIGTPAMTTRGYKEEQFIEIANYIDEIITHKDDRKYLDAIKEKVSELNKNYPLPN